jgi:hypothetical protein
MNETLGMGLEGSEGSGVKMKKAGSYNGDADGSLHGIFEASWKRGGKPAF